MDDAPLRIATPPQCLHRRVHFARRVGAWLTLILMPALAACQEDVPERLTRPLPAVAPTAPPRESRPINPGITPDAIRIGVPLPRRGPYAANTRARLAGATELLETEQPTIHGRAIELVIREYELEPGDSTRAVVELIEAEEAFVLASPAGPTMLAENAPVFRQYYAMEGLLVFDPLGDAIDGEPYVRRTIADASPEATTGDAGGREQLVALIGLLDRIGPRPTRSKLASVAARSTTSLPTLGHSERQEGLGQDHEPPQP